MNLVRLGLLLAVLAPLAAAQAPRAEGAGPGTAGAERRPIEVRLEEAWRWRQIQPPPEVEAEAHFVIVRPWRDGGLIALDDGGLSAFDGWNWRREPGWEHFRQKTVGDIIAVDDGLVALVDKEIVSVNLEGVVAETSMVQQPFSMTRFTAMPDGSHVFAASGRIWRVTSADLGRLEPLHDAPEGVDEVTALTVDEQGRLWCCTDAGIFRRDEDAWWAVPTDGPAPSRMRHAFSMGSRLHFLPRSIDDITPGIVWDGENLTEFHDKTRPVIVGDAALSPDLELVLTLSTPTLRVYRNGTWADAKPPLSIMDRIQTACITEQGRLAIVTSSGRLWTCDLESRRWEAHDPSAVGLSPMIAAIVPSPSRGGMWIGTHSGLGRWDGGGFADVFIQAGATKVPLRQVTGMAEDARGRLWVVSGSGIQGALCLDGDTWTLHEWKELVGVRYGHVIRRIGDDLWIPLISEEGSDEWELGGTLRLRDDAFEHVVPADGSALGRTYDVVRTSDGRILAGSRGAVHELVDDAWQAWDLPILADRTAWALHPDPEGSLWIGLGLSVKGMVRVRPDRSAQLLNEGSWLHGGAAAFARTADDRMWFAAESGLFLADDQDCHEISGSLPARNFWPVVSDGSTGLWLGTLGSGLVHYVPDDREAPHVREPHVSFSVENRHALLRCDASDRWNVSPPEQLRFRVWVDDEPVLWPGEWSGELRTHLVDLGRLPWGRHEVAVEAVDGLGNRSERRSKEFDVEPPTWLRPPVLLSMVAVALALGWIVAADRSRRRERRAAQRAQAELAERLGVLARKLLSSQEDERKSISRELHDDLGQLLTAVCLDLQHAERSGGDGERREALLRGLTTTRTALDRVRELSSLLRPPVLDDLGLEQAVRSLIEEFTTRSGVDVQVEIELGPAPPPDVLAGQVFRIIQEALTNVARHAGAETAYVTLRARPGRLDLAVSDDGRGFDVGTVPMGDWFGLLGMRERAELLGGTFHLESAAGSGTSIRVSIPLTGAGGAPDGAPNSATPAAPEQGA
ncbi:MAG: sensor histidine kinase [Planctomycetota bacterium]|jgi:signal transduction histidine kinase